MRYYEGIQEKDCVDKYEISQREQRDKGYYGPFIKEILTCEINAGTALEIGPGPGYFGLEWLSLTKDTKLVGAEISKNMIKQAEKNAKEYGLERRCSYILCDATSMMFEDEKFDFVFSSFSLHEWSDPLSVFKEIGRVLKPGGTVYIMDLRRDYDEKIVQFILQSIPEKEMKDGFIDSLDAAYTRKEIEDLLSRQEKLTIKEFHDHEFKLSFVCKKQ